MHKFRIEDKLEKVLSKLSKKDKSLYEQIKKKIQEIINSESVEHYKNLKHDLKDYKRIHIGHFVLVFKFDKNLNLISFEDFEHHDRVYGR